MAAPNTSSGAEYRSDSQQVIEKGEYYGGNFNSNRMTSNIGDEPLIQSNHNQSATHSITDMTSNYMLRKSGDTMKGPKFSNPNIKLDKKQAAQNMLNLGMISFGADDNRIKDSLG